MRTETIRPDTDTIINAGWATYGSPSPNTLWKATQDDSGSTGIVGNAFTGILLGTSDPVDAAYTGNNIFIQDVRIRARVKYSIAPNYLRITTQVGNTRDDARYDDIPTTASMTTYNGRRRSTDPNGNRWTKATVSGLGLTCWPVIAAGLDIQELYVDVRYIVPPETTITAPTGLQGTANPLIEWSRTQEDGYTQSKFQVKVFDAATYIRGDFNPQTSTPVRQSGLIDSSAHEWRITDPLPAGNFFRAYVRTAISTPGGQLWSPWAKGLDWYTLFESPAVPTMTLEPQPDAGRVRINLTGRDNLLTANEADFERVAETATWTQLTGTVTITRSATGSLGTYAMRITPNSSADCSVTGPFGGAFVRPGEIISARCRVKAVTAAKSVRVGLVSWSDIGFTGSQVGTSAADNTSGYTEYVVEGFTIPAGSIYVTMYIEILSATSGQAHDVDEIELARASTLTGTPFRRGGFWNRNVLLTEESDFEVSVGSWSAYGTNTTVTRSTTVGGNHGTAAMRLAAGVANAGVAAQTFVYPILGDQDYYALAAFRPGTGSYPCAVGVQFYDGNVGQIGGPIGLDDTTVATAGAWEELATPVHSPPGAAWAAVIVTANNAFASGAFTYVDTVSLARAEPTGVIPLWSRGGDSLVSTTFRVEYSDDGGTTWTPIRAGAQITPDVYQRRVVYDNEVPPLEIRRYRARTEASDSYVAFAPAVIVSAWTPEVYAATPTTRWWLKSLTDPELSVGSADDVLFLRDGVSRQIEDRSGRFVGVGATYPVFVTDSTGGDDGQLTVRVYSNARFEALRTLLRDREPLLLVDPIAQEQYYIKLTGSRSWDEKNVQAGPVRDVTISYEQVDRPAS